MSILNAQHKELVMNFIGSIINSNYALTHQTVHSENLLDIAANINVQEVMEEELDSPY